MSIYRIEKEIRKIVYYKKGKVIKKISYFPNKCKHYEYEYKNNKYHKGKDKPAVVHYYSNGNKLFESYYLNGIRHRNEGKPAEIWYDEDGIREYEFYYNKGEIYKVKEYKKDTIDWKNIYTLANYNIEFLTKYSNQLSKYITREEKFKVIEYKMKENV